jgi:hypothetical protein
MSTIRCLLARDDSFPNRDVSMSAMAQIKIWTTCRTCVIFILGALAVGNQGETSWSAPGNEAI